MKAIILLAGILAMFTLTACEEMHEHGHHGGDYDHYDNGYGHGYGYPNNGPYYNNPNYRY